MSSAIADEWIYSTMLIENEWGHTGTGFMVARQIGKHDRIFLVTNKHVLDDDPQLRRDAVKVTLHLNKRDPDGSISSQIADVALALDDGMKRFREHPDPDIDLLAIDISSAFVQFPQIARRWVRYNYFADRAKLAELDIAIGDDVAMIGYPLGLRHRTTNFPIVRSGIIATRIGEELEDEIPVPGGGTRRRVIRGFLVDGATVPGSSGSPVVLRPLLGRVVRGELMMETPPAVLLGIVSETLYAPVTIPGGSLPSFAGLGLAFDAETIRETIELFFAKESEAP